MSNNQGPEREDAPPDWKLPKMPEMEPLQGERSISVAVCARKQKYGPPNADQGYSTATVTMHCHLEGDTHPHSPVPPFPLAQNLSSK